MACFASMSIACNRSPRRGGGTGHAGSPSSAGPDDAQYGDRPRLGFLTIEDRDVVDISAAEQMGPIRMLSHRHQNPGRAAVRAVPDVALTRATTSVSPPMRLPDHPVLVADSRQRRGRLRRHRRAVKIGARVVTNQQQRVHHLEFSSGRVTVPRRTTGHPTAQPSCRVGRGSNCEPTPNSPPPPECRGFDRCWRRTASTSTWWTVGEHRDAVPVGQMFIDGLVSGDVGDDALENG